MSVGLTALSELFKDRICFERLMLETAGKIGRGGNLTSTDLKNTTPKILGEKALRAAGDLFDEMVRDCCKQTYLNIQQRIDSQDTTEKKIEVLRSFSNEVHRIVEQIEELQNVYPDYGLETVNATFKKSVSKIYGIKSVEAFYKLDFFQATNVLDKSIALYNPSVKKAVGDIQSAGVIWLFSSPLVRCRFHLLYLNDIIFIQHNHLWKLLYKLEGEPTKSGEFKFKLKRIGIDGKRMDYDKLNLDSDVREKTYELLHQFFEEEEREKLNLFLSNKLFDGEICFLSDGKKLIDVFMRLKGIGKIYHSIPTLQVLIKNNFTHCSRKPMIKIDFSETLLVEYTQGKKYLTADEAISANWLPLISKKKMLNNL